MFEGGGGGGAVVWSVSTDPDRSRVLQDAISCVLYA